MSVIRLLEKLFKEDEYQVLDLSGEQLNSFTNNTKIVVSVGKIKTGKNIGQVELARYPNEFKPVACILGLFFPYGAHAITGFQCDGKNYIYDSEKTESVEYNWQFPNFDALRKIYPKVIDDHYCVVFSVKR